MYRPKRRRQRTIAHQVKWILGILLLVLGIYTAGSILLLKKTGNQAIREMDQMSELYTTELDNRFLRISRALFYEMMDTSQSGSKFWEYVNMMEENRSYNYALGKMREYFLSSIWEYGNEYRLFLYLEEDKRLWQLNIDSEGGYGDIKGLEQVIRKQIEDMKDTSYHVKKKWNIISQKGENYMCKIAQNDGVYLGCYVNVKSILEPFTILTMGKNGYVRLVDEQGNNVGMLTSEGISDQLGSMRENDWNVIQRELSQAPFRIQMKISSEYMMQFMMGNIMVLLVIAAIFIFAGVLILAYLRKNLLLPMRNFTQNLEKYDTGEYVFQLTEGNLLELEAIDDKFKHMIRQIRKLKITLYEQELEKQKVEMDFLKLQIRPHFYLNCLNFIYSMIDFKQYDHARKMSRITAEYLTYIFRNTSELVPVQAETDHCRNYLNILLLRYPESFEYYFEVHEEVSEAEIFPFLIQVFVENAAKHALTLDERILISVTVYPEDRENEKYMNIYISDTGHGFSEELLKKLERGEDISENGKHVGIMNCLKRFHYYYREKGEINFANSPLGGAIVDIHIPYERNDKG